MDIPDFKQLQGNLEDNLRPPRPELPRFPEMKYKALSLGEIQAKSTDELMAFLTGSDGSKGMLTMPVLAAIQAEITRRSAQPHWS